MGETPGGVVAVTGASRGIGAAICLELARRGFTVGALSRQGRGPQDVAIDAETRGRLVELSCDVLDEESVRRALAELGARPGGLRALVNNAGIYDRGPSHALDTAAFERIVRTNATALFAACREAHPHFVARGGGTIVNIGSFFDKMGVPRNVAYAASKAAVGAITRCLAVEWAPQGIAVVNVAPGYVETDFNREFLARPEIREFLARRIPVGRVSTPEEVARLVAAVLVEQIPCLTGETIYLDGGHAIAH